VPTWYGALGMRASRCDDVVLEGAFIPDRLVIRSVPAGFRGVDAFVLSLLAWTLLGHANIYFGLSCRIFDAVVAMLRRGTSLAMARGSMVHHAGSQDAIAAMAIELASMEPHLEAVARSWTTTDAPAATPLPALFSVQYRAVEAASRIADLALDVAGGSGVLQGTGLERLVRDARVGRIHPATGFLTREIVAKAALGVDLDEQPRWG
jgi:alkylation response protein AidB-like acyl-CoA dehydrogenase